MKEKQLFGCSGCLKVLIYGGILARAVKKSLPEGVFLFRFSFDPAGRFELGQGRKCLDFRSGELSF